MNVKKLNDSIEGLKEDLGKGLIAADIWPTGSGQSVAGFNSHQKQRLCLKK